MLVMSCDGVLDLRTVIGSVDAGKFEEYVAECILPQLQPFSGTNARSVVIFGNASMHHAQGIVEVIQSKGTLLHSVSHQTIAKTGSQSGYVYYITCQSYCRI